MHEGESFVPKEAQEFHAGEPTLEDVFAEADTQGGGLLAKYEMLAERIEKLPISDEDRRALGELQPLGKDKGHLARLLSEGRSDEERTFGLAYLHGLEETFPDMSRVDEQTVAAEIAREKGIAPGEVTGDEINDYVDTWLGVKDVIGNEGEDTRMWWTYAPYLFDAFRRGELGEQDALRATFDWAKEAGEANFDGKMSGVHLKGLEFLKDENGWRTYILSRNPEGASHRFTRARAQEIADTILAERQQKKNQAA